MTVGSSIPYLFILSTEVFSRLLAKDVGIQGISVSRGASTVTHLLYADDLLLARQATTENTRAFVKCLNSFLCLVWTAS